MQNNIYFKNFSTLNSEMVSAGLLKNNFNFISKHNFEVGALSYNHNIPIGTKIELFAEYPTRKGLWFVKVDGIKLNVMVPESEMRQKVIRLNTCPKCKRKY